VIGESGSPSAFYPLSLRFLKFTLPRRYGLRALPLSLLLTSLLRVLPWGFRGDRLSPLRFFETPLHPSALGRMRHAPLPFFWYPVHLALLPLFDILWRFEESFDFVVFEDAFFVFRSSHGPKDTPLVFPDFQAFPNLVGSGVVCAPPADPRAWGGFSGI